MEFNFALSRELFSSAEIDTGTALLLKVFSEELDRGLLRELQNRKGPLHILDAGSGCGVIGICAARALEGIDVRTICTDRDELAGIFTGYNARQNGLESEKFSTHTSTLFDGDAARDLILSNIPAKAGKPVLEDFIRRACPHSEALAFIVAVKPLEDFTRSTIAAAGAEILRETAGSGHTVFVFRRGRAASGPGEGFRQNSFAEERAGSNTAGEEEAFTTVYRRQRLETELEGCALVMDTFHGAPGFDDPGEAVLAAVKLSCKLGFNTAPAGEAGLKNSLKNSMEASSSGKLHENRLFHETEQGCYPLWFYKSSGTEKTQNGKAILSGRNIIALKAAEYNLKNTVNTVLIPTADLASAKDALLGEGPYSFIAAFPENMPRESIPSHWEALAVLLQAQGVFLASLPSFLAELFDRAKISGFTRLGNLRREGFRALAYRKT
ncbi:MAG: methyltransferase [Treponema sp.]|jgi:predicted RNA methylase|nr:methyltransferase [Treponema sp.]